MPPTPSIDHPESTCTPQGLRLWRSPLVRIIGAAMCFMAPFLLVQAGATHLLDNKLHVRLGQLAGSLLGCLSYAMYVRWVERRDASELALAGAGREAAVGLALGMSMVGVSVAAIAALGGLRSMVLAPAHAIALPLLMHLTVGLVEEMLLRGILLRTLQQRLGSVRALALSSAAFAALHLINDDITPLAIANLVVAGMCFGAAFVLTGRLWLCAGLHAGWNFAQDGIFSLPVSGHPVRQGLLVTELQGPDWLTGGAFGIEGSAVDLLLVTLTTAALVALARRRDRMVPGRPTAPGTPRLHP